MRLLPVLLLAAIPLAACAPGADPPPASTSADPGGTAPVAEPVAATPSAAAGTSAGIPPSPDMPTAPTPPAPGAALAGAIRDGNRPPPALRICAHPVSGDPPTCMESPAGAIDYRLGVAPGRYHVMGWVQGGELALIAHARQIRCIAAPCPPDELIAVDVAAGEDKAGVDLAAGYSELPSGWPARP